jgi:hypothetical protein
MILLILSSEHGIAWRDQAGSVKVVVALLNCDAADGSAYKHRKKERVMRLTFVRSGGFAGKATDVEGTVTFTPAGAEVTANGGNYRRELAPAESKQLLESATRAVASKTPSTQTQNAPDAYVYDVAIATADGVVHHLTLGPDTSDLRVLSPALAEWIRHESQEIWAKRIASRK